MYPIWRIRICRHHFQGGRFFQNHKNRWSLEIVPSVQKPTTQWNIEKLNCRMSFFLSYNIRSLITNCLNFARNLSFKNCFYLKIKKCPLNIKEILKKMSLKKSKWKELNLYWKCVWCELQIHVTHILSRSNPTFNWVPNARTVYHIKRCVFSKRLNTCMAAHGRALR